MPLVGVVVNTVCIPADGDVALIDIDEFVACLLIVIAVSFTELRDILDDFSITCADVVFVVVMLSRSVGDGGETFDIVDMVVFVIVVIFMVVLTIEDDLVILDIVGDVAFTVTDEFIVVFLFDIVVVDEIVVFAIIRSVDIVGITAKNEVLLVNIDEFVACLLIVVPA